MKAAISKVDSKRTFFEGMRDGMPGGMVLLTSFTVVAATATSYGLSEAQALFMTILMFAAPAQLAVTELMAQNAATHSIFFTVLLVNLRFAIMASALRPYFGDVKRWKLLFPAPMLSATTFSLTHLKLSNEPNTAKPHIYFVGVCLIGFFMALAGTVGGTGLIKVVPKGLSTLMPMIAGLFLCSRLVSPGFNEKHKAALLGFFLTPLLKPLFGSSAFVGSAFLVIFVHWLVASKEK